MGGKGSGNKGAKGQVGHKGGTGRPPKPTEIRITHKLTLGMNDALYDKIMIAAMEAGYSSYQEFIRNIIVEKILMMKK